MAPYSWLTKAIKSTMNNQETTRKQVGILAFEFSTVLSKLIHLWRALSDTQIYRLRHDVISLEGVRKIVSDDDDFLLNLACGEITEMLRGVIDATSVLCKRCNDQELRTFDKLVKEFADFGRDVNRWAMHWKEMDVKVKRMEKYVASTSVLYKDINELADAEGALKKLGRTAVADAQQKIFWRRQEIKYLKQSSLWGCSIDTAVLLIARGVFTILARVKHVFGISEPGVARSACVVYPEKNSVGLSLFEKRMLIPPETTLGASALALHYANVIVVIDKMIRTPRAVGPEARDDLYGMLPGSLRGMLRRRLRGVGWGGHVRDVKLAKEWREAMGRIVEWVVPMAVSTVRWNAERSFERRNAGAARTNVMMLQTLYFANREKVEAVVAELLVGLNYVWRFEMEMALDLGV